MSILLGAWILSLLVILALLGYGRAHAMRKEAHEHPGVQIQDVVAHEITALNKDFMRILESMKPHGIRTARAGLVMVKRGQELFIHRVYGRMKVERGSASSFFLKHISEHQQHAKKDRI